MKKLTNKHFDYVRKDMKSWYGLNPTVPQLKRFLKGEHLILTEIAIQPYLRYGLDTSIREDVLDIISRKLTGEYWLDGSASKKKVKAFFCKLIKGANKAKVEVEIDEDLY